MSPSDYAFASSTCYNGTTILDNYGNCASSNWLNNGNYQWLLVPYSGRSNSAWYVANGSVYAWYVDIAYGVRPTIYLNSNIGLSGSGTNSDPYKIIR